MSCVHGDYKLQVKIKLELTSAASRKRPKRRSEDSVTTVRRRQVVGDLQSAEWYKVGGKSGCPELSARNTSQRKGFHTDQPWSFSLEYMKDNDGIPHVGK